MNTYARERASQSPAIDAAVSPQEPSFLHLFDVASSVVVRLRINRWIRTCS
jgi:hypothetical protein